MSDAMDNSEYEGVPESKVCIYCGQDSDQDLFQCVEHVSEGRCQRRMHQWDHDVCGLEACGVYCDDNNNYFCPEHIPNFSAKQVACSKLRQQGKWQADWKSPKKRPPPSATEAKSSSRKSKPKVNAFSLMRKSHEQPPSDAAGSSSETPVDVDRSEETPEQAALREMADKLPQMSNIERSQRLRGWKIFSKYWVFFETFGWKLLGGLRKLIELGQGQRH